MPVADHVVHPLLVGRPAVKSWPEHCLVLVNGLPPDALHDEQDVARREDLLVVVVELVGAGGRGINLDRGRKIMVVIVVVVVIIIVVVVHAVGDAPPESAAWGDRTRCRRRRTCLRR